MRRIKPFQLNWKFLICKLSPPKEDKLNLLARFTQLVTVLFLVMLWVEFLWPEYHLGLKGGVTYFMILLTFVVFKEITRWQGRYAKQAKPGWVWVLIWWSSVILMTAISFITRHRLCPPVEQYGIAVAVSVTFLISQCSKLRFERPTQKTSRKVGKKREAESS